MTKRLIKDAFRRLGYDLSSIERSPPSDIAPAVDALGMWLWLRSTQNIRTVIDIGAHTGEFADFLHKWFNPAATYLFEPLASCGEALREKAASIPNLSVFQVAISDEAGESPLYENAYAPATSLLRVGPISRAEFPETAAELPATVRTARLDDLLDLEALPRQIFIKVDIQGAEDRAIRGGWRTFRAARCVLIEMGFVPMYGGQPLFEDVHRLLIDLGFSFSGIKNQVHSPRSGQPLFAHCLYVRREDGGGA